MPNLDLNKEDYPSNSISGRRPNTKRVTTARVIPERRSFLARFIGETGMGVIDYIFRDVLVPAAKSTISDIVSNGFEMLLYGDSTSRTSSRRKDRSRTKVSYTDYYERKDRSHETPVRERRNRNRHDFDQFIIPNRREAQDVIDQLAEIIDIYDLATVSDLYRLLDLDDNEWTDNKFGWYNISRASIIRVRDGYVLDLPAPEPV